MTDLAALLKPDQGQPAIPLQLVDKKGFEVLIEAAPRILAGAPRARIVIGGAGDLGPRLERRAGELGVAARVRFTGGLSHIWAAVRPLFP